MAGLAVATPQALPHTGWAPSHFSYGGTGIFNTDSFMGIFVDVALAAELMVVVGDSLEFLLAEREVLLKAGYLMLGPAEDPLAVAFRVNASAECWTSRLEDQDLAVRADLL